MTMDPEQIYFITVAAFFGAITGSFLGVIIERRPARQTISGRSHCSCGRQLPAYENVPIFSWLLLRGKARCCHTPIPAWYFALEVATTLIFAAAAAAPGHPALRAAATLLLTWAATALIVHRRRRQIERAPDQQPGS